MIKIILNGPHADGNLFFSIMEAVEGAHPLIRIHPADNIGVLPCSVGEGERLRIDDEEIRSHKPMELGHKVALCPIAKGDKIFKYGVPIGSATQRIDRGEHVHLHNMKSDYLPTYTLNPGEKFRG